MQQFSVCPGCGRLVGTRYPFMHQSGRTAMVVLPHFMLRPVASRAGVDTAPNLCGLRVRIA
jgi:hypothetical protein